MTKDSDPRWRTYEQSVRVLIAAMDQTTEVLHDRKLFGTLSGIHRQVDVLIKGQVESCDKIVVVECKKHDRRVNITAVDQFVGTLLDLGADKGFLYSYSGFSVGALARADGATRPEVVPVQFEDDAGADSPVLSAADRADSAAFLVEELDTEMFRELLTGR